MLSFGFTAEAIKAARLWEIRTRGPREIHISMPAHVDRKGPGIRPHRVAALVASDLTTHRGVPVTSPIRTLIDLATQLHTQVELNGFKVDFYWPELGLVVETDGLTYQRTPAQQAKDTLRNQVHAAEGLTPLRFTHGQIRFEREHVRTTLGAVARRLGHPSPPWESARGA